MPMTSAASSSSRSASMARPIREPAELEEEQQEHHHGDGHAGQRAWHWRMPPNPDAAPVGSKFRKKMRTISPKPIVRISR